MTESNSTPLYSQLSLALMDYIVNHAQIHQKMLSEREICREYQVSRTTVRSALKELENLGYIYKRQGKGTFVSSLWKERQNLSEGYSFTDQMKELGKQPETNVLSFERFPADALLAQQLGISEGESVIRLERLRMADSITMMYETTYLPDSLFPTLSADSVRQKPLYEIFSTEFQQSIKYADEVFSASIVTSQEATLLHTKPNAACLRLKRTTFNKENRIVEFTLSVARSDQFVYKVRHYRN